jgi:hypothetical protein
MTTVDTPIQQSTADTPSKKTAKTDTTTKPSATSSGLQYSKDYPKAIRKTIKPSIKEEVDILFDFAMPNDDAILVIGDKTPTPGAMLNDLKADGKAPRFWFNKLVQKHGYEKTLWFILNLKATLLSSTNANLLKEWRLSDKFKFPPQDIQEVGAISSLYEKKRGNDKIIDINTKIIKDYIFEVDEQTEERKEIILNIALGNVGGLYVPLVKRGKGDSSKKEGAA